MVWRMCICLWIMRRLGREEEEEDRRVLRVRMGQDQLRARTNEKGAGSSANVAPSALSLTYQPL